MIILSDCITEKVDEGCLKVANNLIKKIKEKNPDTLVISYKNKPKYSDLHLKLNKLFLNVSLLSVIREKRETLLYIPFASNTMASIVRTCVLSRMARGKVKVLFAVRFSMNKVAKKILQKSNAQIIALSKESYEFYSTEIGANVIYLKTGVDTSRFVPVGIEKKKELREKYKVDQNKKVLLHVGHLKMGRNVDKLLNISEDYHILLVVSSVTEIDLQLKQKLNERSNITIFDMYLEHIEEIYQMADVYLFPVQERENCIDIPLSVLEAAACNIPDRKSVV